MMIQGERDMKTFEIQILGGVEVNVHNVREEILKNVFEHRIEDIKRYHEDKTFGENTDRHIMRIARECEHYTFAMYHLDMLKNVITDYELLKLLDIEVY